MNSGTLQIYKHSGKFNPLRLVLSLAATTAIAFPLGIAYANLLRIPSVQVCVLVTIFYGAAVAFFTMYFLNASQVRNTALAVLTGLVAGLIALYMAWSGRLHVFFEVSPWFFFPDQIMQGMSMLNEQGSWRTGVYGTNKTGYELGIIWVGEAGIIVGPAVWAAFYFTGKTPFCEKTKCWLDEVKTIDTLEQFTDPAQLAALKAGNILPITQAKPKEEGAKEFTRLLLKRSPQCKIFCTLRVQHATLTINTKGNEDIKIQDLTNDLIIPASMFELIAKLEEFAPPPSPG